MANKNILTYNAKISQVEQNYYAPVAFLENTNIPISALYCFLSKVEPWQNENDPVTPSQNQLYIKQVFKNIFVLKKIRSSDISPVIERIDWTSGTTYDYYSDSQDMFATDSNGLLIKKFYVRNRYNQVFKCLWNNNGVASTQEPFFQPGYYGTNNIFQSTDGYKWRYIYTIDLGNRSKFMDNNWMPVPVGQQTPGAVFDIHGQQTGTWAGGIEVINVLNGGSGYSNAVPVIVNITGDGVSANASAVVSNGGTITDVIVVDPGTNYSYANVSISSDVGSGVQIVSPLSPIGGHGFDPVSELGCSRSMITVEFNGSENGVIPTDIDYRQIGLISNPVEKKTYPYPANNSIYSSTTDVIVASGFGNFVCDEIIYQGIDVNNSTFSATILSFNASTNVVKLINTKGTPITNVPIFGNTSQTARTVMDVSYPDILLPSGYLSYIENRTGVQRSVDGIEQFKFILGY